MTVFIIQTTIYFIVWGLCYYFGWKNGIRHQTLKMMDTDEHKRLVQELYSDVVEKYVDEKWAEFMGIHQKIEEKYAKKLNNTDDESS